MNPVERNRFAVEEQRRGGQRRPPMVSTVFAWPEWPRGGQHRRLRMTEETAQALKVQVHVMAASDRNGLDEVLEVMVRARPAGLIVFDDPVFSRYRQRIIEFATRHRIPTVYSQSGWAEQSGLMEYAL